MTKNPHPGKTLKKDFIDKKKITVYQLAKEALLSQTRLGEIIKGERRISVETALKLGKFFSTKPEYWLNLQMNYDLEIASKEIQKELVLIKKMS